MDIEALRLFFGWAAVFNMGILAVTTLFIVVLPFNITAFHAKLFKLSEKEVSRLYFQYLGNLKIMTLVFSLVPYLVLRFMF